MTRSTQSLHRIADQELSAAAAMRTLRSIAYREWDVYRAPALPDPSDTQPVMDDEVETAFLIDLSLADPAVAEAIDSSVSSVPSEGGRTWYLNEVPAEWLGEYRRDEDPSTPLSA